MIYSTTKGLEIKPNTIVAFFDAEYTARSNTDKGIQEMIQCALYISRYEEDGQWTELAEYVSYVKPLYVPTLSEFIIDFTGIQQEDVDNAKLFTSAINEIYELCKKYKVSKIYVWGPDKMVLKYNMELTRAPYRRSKILLSKIEDVSERVSTSLGFNYILSQVNACEELQITPNGKPHDAGRDAQSLRQIMYKYFQQNK